MFSLFKVGPPIDDISTTSNLRFLMIKYQDNSFAVIDRTVLNPSQAIMGYSYGHFEKINGISWMGTNKNKRDLLLQ